MQTTISTSPSTLKIRVDGNYLHVNDRKVCFHGKEKLLEVIHAVIKAPEHKIGHEHLFKMNGLAAATNSSDRIRRSARHNNIKTLSRARIHLRDQLGDEFHHVDWLPHSLRLGQWRLYRLEPQAVVQ